MSASDVEVGKNYFQVLRLYRIRNDEDDSIFVSS